MTDTLKRLELDISTGSTAEVAVLLGELERLKAMAWGRIMVGTGGSANQAASHDGELLTIPEVAPRLKVSVYRAYELARQGQLRSVRIGKSVRVTMSAVTEFLARLGCPKNC